MANIKISDLTAAAAATGTQQFEVNDSLTSKKVTGAQVLAYVESNLTIQNNAVTTAKIADNNVTLAKLQDIATASILGRNTAGTGDPEVLTGAQARSIVGADNASNLTSGTVGTARLASGTANSTTFLRGDQTWATAGGAPASLGDIGTVMWATINTTSNLFPGNTVAGSSCYYPTAFSAVVNSNTTFTEGTNNSNPRTEYRVNQNVGTGVATTVRTQSGNTGYQFSTTNLAALSGTWRVLLPMVARSSSYNSCDVATESVTRGTLIQRIS
jgi:hypothetical protein